MGGGVLVNLAALCVLVAGQGDRQPQAISTVTGYDTFKPQCSGGFSVRKAVPATYKAPTILNFQVR
ncbi:hypothetical protein Hamer_G003597, partial [Homarus americanus]